MYYWLLIPFYIIGLYFLASATYGRSHPLIRWLWERRKQHVVLVILAWVVLLITWPILWSSFVYIWGKMVVKEVVEWWKGD